MAMKKLVGLGFVLMAASQTAMAMNGHGRRFAAGGNGDALRESMTPSRAGYEELAAAQRLAEHRLRQMFDTGSVAGRRVASGEPDSRAEHGFGGRMMTTPGDLEALFTVLRSWNTSGREKDEAVAALRPLLGFDPREAGGRPADE